MTPPKVNGRPWDSFDGYLFDIDGTLIHCTDAVHYFAFCEALTTISGRSLTLEGVATQGNVDVGILRDAFALAGIPESRWRPQLPAILGGMGDFVAARTQDLCPNILPRVRDVLDHLRAKGASLGVATGNLRRIGELKLQRAGILDYFQIGGWSDEFECRPDVIRAAAPGTWRRPNPSSTWALVDCRPKETRLTPAAR